MASSMGAGSRAVIGISCIFLVIGLSHGKGTLKHIGEDDWSQLLDGEWMVEFYAPWCPACKALQPIWSEFATWSEDLEIKVGAVDITESPGLSGRFMITALPTIFHVKDGIFRQYKGSRDREQFISFVEEKKWQQLETVSSWKAPDSVQMSVLAQFFRLSMVLRNVHTSLTEEYGVPVWGSYLLFILATVIIGALLGLLFVCCIDVCCAQKSGELPPEITKKDDDAAKKQSGDGKDDDEEKEEAEEEEEEEEESAPKEKSSPEARKRRTRKAD
ncbi:thioredoxin-related transmembrane protein 1-like [Amphibalanus amphitrite]|uniref:thioredoxin-related transmembrane protein 1-like n=1 Tax=Amphibalanus amphitrite TaxID=1232801 RepID=UPI001C8FB435|nr:thioredoxin-related transmembrane protein 1-like [Amphibalanus amphitrite]